jgi:ribosome-associated protein
MDDTLQTNALELGKLLTDHNGLEVVVMDMRPLNFWTDFFIIATVTSNTHLSGLQRHIKDYTREKGMEILHRSKKPDKTELSAEEWNLLDLGGIVIHLMTAKIRNFFELERLWSTAPIILGQPPNYSSNSPYGRSSS